MSFILMGPNFNRGRAVAVKKKSTKKRKCIRLYFKNTIPSKGYYSHSIESAEIQGPEYVQAVVCPLPPPLPQIFCFPSRLFFLLFSYFNSVFIKAHPKNKGVYCSFAINANTRRNTSMSAKCPRVLGENFEGGRGKCSSVY